MYPRQVQQYIGRKLGEFYGLLLTRRRSIVLSVEEDLKTTLKRSKNWRWEKHFFVVWYLTPFQILCLNSKKILAWCSNQLVATIIKLIWSYPGGGFFEFASFFLFLLLLPFFFFFFFFLLNGKILLRREWETTPTSPEITSKRFRGAELGPKKPKMIFSKDQWANIWAALLATLGTQSKEIGLFIITVY